MDTAASHNIFLLGNLGAAPSAPDNGGGAGIDLNQNFLSQFQPRPIEDISSNPNGVFNNDINNAFSGANGNLVGNLSQLSQQALFQQQQQQQSNGFGQQQQQTQDMNVMQGALMQQYLQEQIMAQQQRQMQLAELMSSYPAMQQQQQASLSSEQNQFPYSLQNHQGIFNSNNNNNNDLSTSMNSLSSNNVSAGFTQGTTTNGLMDATTNNQLELLQQLQDMQDNHQGLQSQQSSSMISLQQQQLQQHMLQLQQQQQMQQQQQQQAQEQQIQMQLQQQQLQLQQANLTSSLQGPTKAQIPQLDIQQQQPGSSTGNDVYAANGMLGPWSATSAGLLGKMVASDTNAEDPLKARRMRKKPKDRPKRPLSAYNIFFKEERQRILEKIPESEVKHDPKAKPTRKRKKNPHGKIGFESLAKVIGQRWQDLNVTEVEVYKKKAEKDMTRYKEEMEVYLSKQNNSNNNGDNDSKKSNDDDDESSTEESTTNNKKQKTTVTPETSESGDDI